MRLPGMPGLDTILSLQHIDFFGIRVYTPGLLAAASALYVTASFYSIPFFKCNHGVRMEFKIYLSNVFSASDAIAFVEGCASAPAAAI